MDKRGIIKLSAGFFLLLLLLILVFSTFFSSATPTGSYSLGEEINIDLSDYGACSLKVKFPSGIETQYACEDKFSLVFEEVGEYVINIKSESSSERMEFQVNSDREESVLFNFEDGNSYPLWSTLKFDLNSLGNYELVIISPSGERTSRVSSNDLFFFDILEEGEYSIMFERGNLIEYYKFLSVSSVTDQLVQGKAEINKPVSWNKVIEGGSSDPIEIPLSTNNLILKKSDGGEIFLDYQIIESNGKKYIQLNNAPSEPLTLEYFTDPPQVQEKTISETMKEVVVSSPDEVHYEEVLAYTTIPERLYVGQENLIKLYWREENRYLDFQAKDTNDNGLLDYLEWTVPHLSNQTFDIILITKAEHLSSDRTFISGIYEQVKELDDVWSETIPDGDYVRVTFEVPLDNTRDITLYPRIISGNPIIEVYGFNSTEKITEFNPLISDEYNKIYLTNLTGQQDTFDLRVVDGSLELDHIIDPEAFYNVNSSKDTIWARPTSSSRWTSGTNATGSQYANMATENNVYASVTPFSNNDYPIWRFNFTINENVAYINSIYIRFTGYGSGTSSNDQATAYVWRFSDSSWVTIGDLPGSNGNVTLNITSSISNYLDSNNHLVVLAEGANYDPGDYIFVDYVGVTVGYTTETIPPIYNSASVNSTIPDEIAKFSINVSDNVALHPNGQYIFSTNNTGMWVNDSAINFTTTPSWANVTKTLNSTSEISIGYRWYFNDSAGNMNSTPIYTLTTLSYPPAGAQIQCEKDGSWRDCAELGFFDNLTRVRINCTGGVINASFNLTNIPDGKTFFSSNATSNETTWWIYDNPDVFINDSGTFNLSTVCYGYYSQAKSYTNWTVPWGNLTVELVSPSTNINVNPDEFFNFTVNVTCSGGECGNANVTLDPSASWWDQDYTNRKKINITNPSAYILVENYSMVLVVDTSGDDFQDDGDDLRIVYWNGTHNLELDRFNDSLFNIATTNIWFRIQSNISPGEYDDNYYMYYNNSDAVNPPNNGSKVFEFFDDFNRADSGTVGNGWTESTGTWQILSGWVRNTMNGDSDLTQLGRSSTNHSIRAIANQVVDDADLKLSVRSALSPTRGYTFGYQNGYLELTSGNHNTANLGSSAISTMAGVPYELEINAFENRITTYKDGTLIFNVTDSSVSSGFFLLHSWDVSEFDDVWVRKIIDVEPTYSMGNVETRTKGIISTITGATPFYTISGNPMDYVQDSCLGNMLSGKSCSITWQVNATGKIGSKWDFFAYVNNTNYTSYFNSSYVSSKINITIGNLPPAVPELNFPANASAIGSIGEFNWSNSLDPTGDTVSYMIEISNSSDFSYMVYANYSVPETENITGVTPTGITQEGAYYWKVLATDLKENSSWSETRVFFYDSSDPVVHAIYPPNLLTINTSNTINFVYNVSDLSPIKSCNLVINGSINDTSTNITKDTNLTFEVFLPNSYYSWKINCTDLADRVGDSGEGYFTVDVSNNPPVAREIECEKEEHWYNCSSIEFGDALTGVRVRCTDPESGVVNASLTLRNVPDDYTYFSNTTTDNLGDYWVFNNDDFVINDSGQFELNATCYDSESLSGDNSSSWDVPWGSFTVDLLNPNANTSVMEKSFFTFSSRINCVGGECGNANVTLDPVNWWNDTWYYRKTINITNSGSTTLSNFTIYLNLSKETEMQSDFDDIRFINGSCGSSATYTSLNYEIENYTSSKADVWIRIPSFVPGVNQICMYYGNSFVSSGASSINTWNYNYMTVQHLEETGTGTRYDSTFRRNFTTAGYDGDEKVSGEVDGADSFDGTNDALNSTNNFMSNSGSFTLEGWIKPRVWGSRISLFGQNDVIEFFLDGSNTVMIWTSGGGSTSTSYPYSLDTWHHVAAVGTGTSLLIYFDGAQAVSGGSSTSNYGSSSYSVKIGEGVVDASGGYFNGSMDEVRISNTSRSADWINQSYQIVSNQNNLVSFGNVEEKSKGIISTITGATPFYTTTPNPLNLSAFSCLGNMKSSGASCDVNWSVNATGELNSVWEFFVSANNLNYWDYFNTSSESSRIYITIASQVPPSVPQLYRPLNATAYSSVPNLNWTNSTDQNGDPIYYILEVSNSSDFSYLVYANYSIPETASPTNKTPTGITDEGAYYWRVRATDLIGNSSWSETRVFYYVTSGPTINFLNQTGEDERIINSTNWLNRGENLTIFVNTSGISVDKVWVVVWQSVIGGAQKIKVFFTSLGNSLWKANVPTNQTWDAFYNYTIYANDTLGSEVNYSSNFTVLGGNATINLSSFVIEMVTNVTVYGHINLTNSTNLTNYPINLWLDGNLLFLSNLTPEGTYNFYKSNQETSTADFSTGTFYQTEIQGNENITLSSGVTSGNFTKILDAGALVSWDNLSWSFQGASCSGTFSYQEGDSNSYSGTRDTYIDSGFPTTNYANSDVLVDGSPTLQRGLIKFENIIGRNYYQIPENSTINNANLTFYVSDTGDLTSVYQVLENWTESQATYNNRLTGTSWSTSGCSGNPSRASSSDDSFTASSTGAYTIDISNSINSWVSGTTENYGWVFDIPTSNGINIRSSEYTTQSQRPLLMVDYSATECTNLIVYVRTSNDKITWSSWKQVSNGGAINDSNIYSRYLQYKVEFTAVNPTITPVLKDITINYTAVTTDANGDYRYNFTSPSQFGNHSVLVNTSFKTILISNSTNLSAQVGVPPNVSLVSPTPNQWFSYGELNLTYNASDGNDNLAFSELIINGVVNQTNSTPITNYGYTNFTINFSSGQYNWTVNVTDGSGYRATTSERTFYIDLEDPNVSLIYPGNESPFETNQLNLSFNATDNMDTNLSCNVVLDGNTIGGVVWAENATATNVSSGILTGGIHYWNVTCTDNALRNFTSETFNFNISDTPPNITLVSPAPDYLDNDGIISFIYNASDNTGFINCSLFINGEINQTNSTPINNHQNNAFSVEGFLEGYYNWTVECFDLSETSGKPPERNFSEDLYKPTIDLDTPTNSGTSTTSTVYFNFTVNDTFDSSLNCNLTINGVKVDNFTADSGNFTTRPIYNLTDGIKYWNVTCIDDALHSNTSATWTVNITEYPKIVLNTENESRFNQTLINLTYTPSDNTNLSSCSLYLNGIFNQSNSTSVLNGQKNNFTLNTIPEGEYNWTVNCSDYYGLSNVSETRIFYADRTAPQINVSYPLEGDIYAANITFNFTLFDAIDSNLSCNITVNSSVVAENFSANNGSITSKEVAGITEGFNIWNVTCWDRAGNLNTSSNFNFTKYTNPNSNLISPDNNTWFNISNVTLVYLPEDDGGIVNASLYLNGIYNRSNSTPIINHDYNNFSLTDFADGSYFWNVNVTDPTGLTGIGEEKRFYIDTAPPSLILNAPNDSVTVTSNNVTFNFTIFDNLADFILCNVTLNGEFESSGVYPNSSDVIKYSTLGDGNHTWKVDCLDNASNWNSSDTMNFTVKAPPNVSLIYPADEFRTKNSSLNFTYIPYDLIGIKNCSIYLDGAFNDTNSSVQKNQENNFTISGILEGEHNWTVNCTDSDDNWNWSEENIFYRDLSPPSIILNSPDNNSGIDFNNDRVYFNWTPIDVLDDILQCNLTVDGIVREPNVWVGNGSPIRKYVFTSVLGQGEHWWNVTCWDQLKNTNTSELRMFNLTYPDFFVNSSEIFSNESSPKENQSIEITATVYNLAGADISNVTVNFYNGDPDSGGTKIGQDIFINLSKFSYTNVSVNWSSQIGPSDIFVIIDPPLATNGTYDELNESNNKAWKTISVGSWNFFYGDILSFSEFVLANNGSSKLVNWSTDGFDEGNVYVTDYDSFVSWVTLQALGKTKSNGDSSSDFSEVDTLLNSTNYTDSVYSVYTDSGVPTYTSDIYAFNNLIQEVPIINSTNNSNFVTGILWDYSDDTEGADGEFDLSDKEDLVFVAPINKQAEGAYGNYDYEIRIPAKLREYKTPDTKSAVFYVEIY